MAAVAAQASAFHLFNAAIIVIVLAAIPSAWADCNVLELGVKLEADQALTIDDYRLVMQKDCNLVLYKGQKPYWATLTQNMGTNCYLELMGDGELVLYSGNQQMLWRTETAGDFGTYILILKPDGNLMVQSRPTWSTGITSITQPKR